MCLESVSSESLPDKPRPFVGAFCTCFKDGISNEELPNCSLSVLSHSALETAFNFGFSNWIAFAMYRRF